MAIMFLRLKILQYTYMVLMHFTWRDVEADSEEMEEIRKDLLTVISGFAALPINFPGFANHKAAKVCSQG